MISIKKEDCAICGLCVDLCPTSALRLTPKDVIVYSERCIDCGICAQKCPFNAIKMARPAFFGIKDVRFQVTKACNFKCPHCFSNAGKKSKNEMSFSKAKAVLDKLIENGMVTLTLTGGEPLMRKYFSIAVINYLRSKKVYVKLFTNGFYLDKDTISRIKDVNEVQISIDGLQESHDEWRGQTGSWRKLWKDVVELKHFKITTSIRFTVSSLNYYQTKAILKMCEEKGVDIFKIRPVILKGRAEENPYYAMDKEKYYRESIGYISNIRRMKKYVIQALIPSFAFLYDNSISLNSLHGNFKGCVSCRAIMMATLLPDGYLNPCPYFSENLGNLKRERFSSIQTNIENFAQKILNIKNLDKECLGCPYIAICGGGCRANAIKGFGYLEAPDPNCPRILEKA